MDKGDAVITTKDIELKTVTLPKGTELEYRLTLKSIDSHIVIWHNDIQDIMFDVGFDEIEKMLVI